MERELFKKQYQEASEIRDPLFKRRYNNLMHGLIQK